MSMPSIRGFTERPRNDTLADLWTKPAGEYPAALWPADALQTVTTQPTGWLTIEQLTSNADIREGRGCVLVAPDHAPDALEDTQWVGRYLGSIEVWANGGFDTGLFKSENDVDLEFFVQARLPTGAGLPVVEVAYPFLWYWDAHPVNNELGVSEQRGSKV
ncbi:hypothetical protein ACIBG0_33335 [Nocardia sp. NPDC050630]|uniref:hypothetical protein n=1 Tax=Nocardia sp. NPDC050630 TaxID=3364321 RepID=UPI0037AD4420